MLVALLNVPKTENDWNTWSYHHRLSHAAILDAIATQKKTQLTEYVLDPIPFQNFSDWAERNQQMHVDMDAAVGAQSVDLTDVNVEDERQLQAWVYLHFLEHQTAEQKLGIAS